MTFLIFLGVLSLLVFVHEAGHFLVAKKAGIRVEEFGFGIEISLFVLSGIIFSFIVEKFVRWRHCHMPVDEKHAYPREFLLNNIVILLGGRAAEEIILKDYTTGAGNDIERATALARKMVCEWGMSESIGPLSYGKKEEQIFLGREFASHKDYSEETAKKIDAEINQIVFSSYEKAKGILSGNIDLLNSIALVLLEKEVLTGQELDALIKGDTPQSEENSQIEKTA